MRNFVVVVLAHYKNVYILMQAVNGMGAVEGPGEGLAGSGTSYRLH